MNGKPTTKWENFVQPTVQNSESDDDGTNEQDGIEKEPVDVTYQVITTKFITEKILTEKKETKFFKGQFSGICGGSVGIDAIHIGGY